MATVGTMAVFGVVCASAFAGDIARRPQTATTGEISARNKLARGFIGLLRSRPLAEGRDGLPSVGDRAGWRQTWTSRPPELPPSPWATASLAEARSARGGGKFRPTKV